MKKTIWWIVGIVLVLSIGAGGFIWLRRRRKDDAPPPKPQGFDIQPGGAGVLDANAALADPNRLENTMPPPAPAALVQESSADTQAAIAAEARRIERNTQMRNIVAKREQIGQTLFDGIPEQSRDIIAASFGAAFAPLDAQNLMSYPIYGKYNVPERAALRAQLDAIIKANPSGFTFNTKADKMGRIDATEARRGIVPAWANYNFLTGKNGAATFSAQETEYFLRANNIKVNTERGFIVTKLLQNFIAEIDRLNAALYEQAVANLIHKGWRIAGRSAPTKDEVN